MSAHDDDCKTYGLGGIALDKVREMIAGTECDLSDATVSVRDLRRIVALCDALNAKCGRLRSDLRDAEARAFTLRPADPIDPKRPTTSGPTLDECRAKFNNVDRFEKPADDAFAGLSDLAALSLRGLIRGELLEAVRRASANATRDAFQSAFQQMLSKP